MVYESFSKLININVVYFIINIWHLFLKSAGKPKRENNNKEKMDLVTSPLLV
jgi:hypothetical protein